MSEHCSDKLWECHRASLTCIHSATARCHGWPCRKSAHTKSLKHTCNSTHANSLKKIQWHVRKCIVSQLLHVTCIFHHRTDASYTTGKTSSQIKLKLLSKPHYRLTFMFSCGTDLNAFLANITAVKVMFLWWFIFSPCLSLPGWLAA